MARREDDKCASYGSLFIGQSSGTQLETEHGRRKGKPVGAGEAGEIRCEIRFAPKQVWTLWGRAEKPGHWKAKGATGAANSHIAGLLMFS